MLKKSLLLVGISGAGKSTVGRLLAEELGVAFVDLDDRVEQEAGMSVGAIFDKLGQSRFRDLETKVLSEALDAHPPLVIATGGGAMERTQNQEKARDHGVLVWLEVSPEMAAARCHQGNDRPLLRDGDAVKTLNQLLVNRTVGYQEARIVVQTDGRTPEGVVSHIVDALAKGRGQ